MNELWDIIAYDYYRNTGNKASFIAFAKIFFRRKYDSMKFLVCFRIAQSFKKKKLINKITCLFYRHYAQKYNFEIPLNAKVGKGLRLPHYASGVVLHPNVTLGDNCEIMQGVTIGNNIMKDRYAVAQIGNNVILGAGCKVIGKLTIGDNVFVGANAVVCHDIPSNSIVAGSPARVIKENCKPIIINSEYSGEK